MITKRICLTIAALAGLWLTVGQTAQAQVIVQTFTWPSASFPNEFTSFTDTFPFSTFNTGLGVLTNVTLSMSATVQEFVQYSNGTPTTVTMTGVTATTPIVVTGPGSFSATVDATAGPITQTVGPFGSGTIPGSVENLSDSVTIPSTSWAMYENPPSGVNATFTLNGDTATIGGSVPRGLLVGGFADTSGTVTLTYDYFNPGSIPEPGSTTFLAAGVLGSLGMVMRRRRKA